MIRMQHMPSSAFVPMVALLLCLTSCNDDPTAPAASGFSVEVIVSLADGSPVEGVDVVVWNLSSSLQHYLQDSVFPRRAATDLEFSLAEPGDCWLEVTDLEGRVVQTVIDGTTLPVGRHSVRIGASIEYTSGVEVFRYELRVHDPESGAERFRDAKYMTAVHLDRTRLLPRTTDTEGRIRIDDPTCVPGLYELPTLSAVDEAGDPMGGFALDDSLTIGLFDGAGNSLYVERVVVNGPNRFEITWDPSSPSPWGPQSASQSPATKAMHARVPIVPAEDRLDQNRPNPFN